METEQQSAEGREALEGEQVGEQEDQVAEQQGAEPVDEIDEEALLADEDGGEPLAASSADPPVDSQELQVVCVAGVPRSFQPTEVVAIQAAESSTDEDCICLGDYMEVEIVESEGEGSQERAPPSGVEQREPGVGAEDDARPPQGFGTRPRSPRSPARRPRSSTRTELVSIVEEQEEEVSQEMEVETREMEEPRDVASVASDGNAESTDEAAMRARIVEIIAETDRAKRAIEEREDAERAAQRRHHPEGLAAEPVYTELNPPPEGWPSQPSNSAWDEDWDQENTASGGHQESTLTDSSESRGRRSRARRRRRRRYNPNRQLTLDDLESAVESRSSTPEPGPPVSRNERPYHSPARWLQAEAERREQERVQASASRAERERRPVEQNNGDGEREVRESEVDGRLRLQRGFPMKRRGVMFGDLAPVPINPTIDPPPFSCFNCWQRGHRLNQCPRPQRQVFCWNCGRRGVDLLTCPRCSETHRKFVESNFAGEREAAPGREVENRERMCREAERRREEIEGNRRDQRREEADLSSRLRGRLEKARECPATTRAVRANEASTSRGVAVSGASSTGTIKKTYPVPLPRVRASAEALPRADADPLATARPPVPPSRAHARQAELSVDAAPASRSNGPRVPEERVNEGASGATAGVRDTLRLLDELRDLPADVREAILRSVFK